MKQLRLLGLMLMAVFALGSTVVASASASERGVLTLKEAASVEATGEAKANKGALTSSGKSIKCETLTINKILLTEPGKTHFNLSKDVDLSFNKCKSEGVACNSEGDGKELILVLVDIHLVNLLDKAGGKLDPGFIALVLSPELTAAGVLILCGLLHITVKGATGGLIEPLNAKNEITLTEEVEKFGLIARPSVVCDKENEKVCEELLAGAPLLANFGAGFVAATEETELYTMTIKPDVLWDD
jgi:hypothetical protein